MNFNQETLDTIKVLSWLRIHRPADESKSYQTLMSTIVTHQLTLKLK
jgi:hypothetical protein